MSPNLLKNIYLEILLIQGDKIWIGRSSFSLLQEVDQAGYSCQLDSDIKICQNLLLTAVTNLLMFFFKKKFLFCLCCCSIRIKKKKKTPILIVYRYRCVQHFLMIKNFALFQNGVQKVLPAKILCRWYYAYSSFWLVFTVQHTLAFDWCWLYTSYSWLIFSP